MTTKMKLSVHQQRVVDHIPWARRLQRSRPCDGWMRSGKKCKKSAYWRFTASKRSWAHDGNYCWSHLISRGLYNDEIESARTVNRWYARGVLCQSTGPDDVRCSRLNDGHNEHHTRPYRLPYSDDPETLHYDHVWVDAL